MSMEILENKENEIDISTIQIWGNPQGSRHTTSRQRSYYLGFDLLKYGMPIDIVLRCWRKNDMLEFDFKNKIALTLVIAMEARRC